MRRHNSLAFVVAVVIAFFVSRPEALLAHPLHTTLTEVTEDRVHGTVRAVIRVFADDFGTAVSHSTGKRTLSPSDWDAAAIGYASRAFGFTDGANRQLAVRSCGIRKTADLLWICLEANNASGVSALRVRSAILCDLFDDQVNVVQANVGGARRSLLFTRGDKAKPFS